MYLIFFQGHLMDFYEKSILFFLIPFLVWITNIWSSFRRFIVFCGMSVLLALILYQNHLERSEQIFLLKYVFSSQSAISWMNIFFILSMIFYWISIVRFPLIHLAKKFAWVAVFMGTTGILVRWREGYLINVDIGHVPISNLYEVLILLCLVISLFYLYYENKYPTGVLGGFIFTIVTSLVIFIEWYSINRDANQIQPLVPALNSWWIKLHVPANFIGYGGFCLSGIIGFAYLIKLNLNNKKDKKVFSSSIKHFPLFMIGSLLFLFPFIYVGKPSEIWIYFLLTNIIVSIFIFSIRNRIASMLPDLEILDDMIYKGISIGFTFFTIAIILGACWAAEAWGSYWQWDPKETWSLIVWMNYAAFLHARLSRGLRGGIIACWSMFGVLIISFAFLGVNIFLSGLHSYGDL
ncbi:MAG: c-type cytochrome biogenesis protein CcsB [Bordetella sp.]|nr:MAG: c-type cytochrome biogenesis protein CcsB [Bordetella sp.]